MAYAPILNADQIDRIRVFATPREVAADEILYNPGDDTPPVFVVITTEQIRHVFVMTGASPKTDWLRGCASLDNKGFVLTGRDIETAKPPIPWPLSRRPHMLETSLPGVFVVGDARSGNIKRVASAVSEGSIVVNLVHQALAET